jgi:glucokinase-like ROK family protein
MYKATHQQTKAYNNQLVLKTIFDSGPLSRADVARATHLTRVTVSEIVAELLETGLIAEVGHGPSTGGKTPILLAVVGDARHLISLDLGADTFRGSIVDLRGHIHHTLSLPFQGSDGDQALELVYELVDALLAALPAGTQRPVLGIGIGAPGLIDTDNGIILQAVHLNWRDLPLGELLHQRYQLPVHLANDCQAAALAEYLFGEGQPGANLVVIKIGHGIGSGIIINGQLYQGDSYSAGEIGHIQAVEAGEPCRCGRSGCLETVASCDALVSHAQNVAIHLREAYLGSMLSCLAANPQAPTFENLVQAFQSGDELACQVALEAARHLGTAIARLVGVLNIHQIILTGNITAFGPRWLETVRWAVSQRLMPGAGYKLRLTFGSLGEEVVILGASALLLTRELGLNPTRFPG